MPLVYFLIYQTSFPGSAGNYVGGRSVAYDNQISTRHISPSGYDSGTINKKKSEGGQCSDQHKFLPTMSIHNQEIKL